MASEIDDLVARGYVFRNEIGFTGVASGAAVYMGVTVGQTSELVVLGRSYSSSESVLVVELFEASFTGGTPARRINRRLSSTRTAPADFFIGVTPGALTTVLTGLTLRAGSTAGSASLQLAGDESKLYLKRGTQYVLRFTNGGSGVAAIGAAFDVRENPLGTTLES